MNFDPASLFASFLVSSIGFVAFAYGKKQSRIPQMAIGFVMMFFPYFVPGVLPMLAIGAVLCFALWFAVRSGM